MKDVLSYHQQIGIIYIIAVLLIIGLFVLLGTKNARKRITTTLAFGMLLLIVAVSGGCSNKKNDIQKEDEEVYEEDTSSEDTSNEDASTKDTSSEDTSTKDTSSDDASSEETAAVKLEIGETEQKELWTQTFVYPNNIDDTFVIDVCLPDDYDENITYPVVYLTDCYWRRGDYEAIKELYETEKTKEFILIGIGYPDDYDFDTIRQRDLLREPQKFLDMIVNGVIPYVESNYNIDSKDRTFCGASYGGFFMIYSLFQSDELTKDVFKNYVLASPTFREYTGGIPLWDYEDIYWSKTNTLNANVYMTVGDKENGYGFKIPIRDFARQIKKRGYSGLNLTYKVYEGKDHYSVWVPTLLDGLEMYLK